MNGDLHHMVGWEDLLLRNRGDGRFEDVTREAGLLDGWLDGEVGFTWASCWGDVDNDGDLDFYMANLAHPRVQPWSDPSMFAINQGPPDFDFVNEREGLGLIYDEGDINAAFADFDHDMDVDLAIASLYEGHYSRLYRNDGAAGFVDVSYETGTAVHNTTSVVWSDVDEDGDLDLALGNIHGSSSQNRLYLNDGTGTFRDATASRMPSDNDPTWFVEFGDVDGDGWLDLYVTNFGPNQLWRNRGDGTFEDWTQRAGVAGDDWSSSASFFDYDGDGRLDLWVANYVEYDLDDPPTCYTANTVPEY